MRRPEGLREQQSRQGGMDMQADGSRKRVSPGGGKEDWTAGRNIGTRVSAAGQGGQEGGSC